MDARGEGDDVGVDGGAGDAIAALVERVASENEVTDRAGSRERGGRGGGAPLFRVYLDAELDEGTVDAATHAMLLQLFEIRALILLIDGIDEACRHAPRHAYAEWPRHS